MIKVRDKVVENYLAILCFNRMTPLKDAFNLHLIWLYLQIKRTYQ